MKIKKGSKKVAAPPADVAAVVDKISTSTNDDDLTAICHDIPIWRYQRSDLHNWIPALDRFDDALANVISSYELSKLQTNDFTPKTKQLVLGVLHITRQMMENCTSRKLYSSYDRLADLLLTTDLDVLHATILLLLRPAQQYGAAIQMEPVIQSTITNRLLILTRGWDQFQDAGVSVVQLASLEIVEPASSRVTIQYYPPEGSSTSISSLDLDASQLSTTDQIVEVADENKIPVDDQLSLLNKARLVHMIRNKETRRKLLASRLLALSTYIFITQEEASQSAIFLYETSLVNQLATLMVPGQGVGDAVLSAAVYAIDACAHHRNKLLEVSAAIGTNVTHGILISLFRDTVRRLTGGGDPEKAEFVMYEVMDALLGLIAYVATSPPHSNHIIGAGIIPIVMDVPKTRADRRDNYIARSFGLVDALVFSTQQGLTAFGNADGVATLVNAVKTEIDILTNLVPPEPTYALSADTIKSYTTTPLKSSLRTIHRLMQAAGGAEGLRSLVDSDLPKLLKHIFTQAKPFGTRVFSLAITTMATIVHSQPTSLSVLQELQLPHALYQELEREIYPAYDILAAIPNAIGALCLNQAGIDFTLEHKGLLGAYIRAAVKDDHSLNLGTYLDELVRHHPQLRQCILDNLLDSLRSQIDLARAFVPSEEDRPRYLLDPADIVTDSDKQVENDHVKDLTRTLNLLHGILRNNTIATDFQAAGGITSLLDIPELPCIPMQHGPTHSPLHISAINLFQVLGEADAIGTARAMLDSIKRSLVTLEEYWKGNKEWSDLGDKLPVLRGMTPRLFYVTNLFAGLPLSHSRNPISMLEELKKGSGDSLLEDLGRFHRSAMVATAKYRAESPPNEDVSINEDFTGSPGKYLSARLYAGLGKTFKSFIRLLFHKRSPEPAQRKAAESVAKSITHILVGHAEEARQFDGAINTVYSTLALATTTSQLFDERGHEGHLHMILFLTFEKRGGLRHLLNLADSLLDAMDGKRSDAGAQVQIVSGVTAAIELLSALARPKAIMSNPQTQALLQRTEYNFSPSEVFIRLRRDIFPYTLRVWSAEWLAQTPLRVGQRGIKSFLTIMEAKDEETLTGQPIPLRAATGIPAQVVRPPTVADPAAVDQLVDMGFPRASAEQALIRARNNVAAAADMILSMPHVFEAAATAAAAAAPAGPAAPVTPAAPPAAEAVAPANPAIDLAAVLVDALVGAGVGANVNPVDAPPAPVIDTALGTPASAAPPTEAAEEEMDVDSKTPSPTESPEAVKKELDAMRAKEKDAIPARAMNLLSASDKLLFDLIPAFPSDQTGLAALLKDFDPEADMTLIANRLKLFALLVHDRNIPDLSQENANAAFNVIKVLPIDAAAPRPPWITSLLLFAETVMLMTTNTIDVKIGDEATPSTSAIRREEADRLVAVCSGIFADTESTREELVSAYRCMVFLTKSTRTIDLANCLAPFKHKLDARLSTCHATLAMILRHSFEDNQTLREVMRREVRNWFAKDKVTDINHFVRQLRQATARDSDAFVDAVEKECALLDPKPASTIYHIRAKEPEKAAASDPFQGDSPSHPAMDLLIKELGLASKATLKDEAITEGYTGLLFSLITEVTGSYISAKKAFMEALREIGLNGPKSRNGIAPIISDLVGCVELGRDLAQEGQNLKHGNTNRQKTISGWAVSMLVALCSDITPTSDGKNVPEELTTIRRTVLDAIVKVLKDSSSQDSSVRYGKLWAIGEVVYRLLTAKPSIGPSRHDDSTLQIAKAMVEKNFVGLMTDAVGSVDLNYPNVKVALISVLRALEHLSKISIKWNKVENKTGTDPAGTREGSVSSSSSEEELEMELDELEDEAPDLYRNSALGILGGDMDENSDGEDDDDDEGDDMMDIYESDLEDDDEAGTEPSTGDDMDEDEDMEDEEDEWTSEDDEENPDDIHPEIVIGGEEPDDVWDEDQDAILEAQDEMGDPDDGEDDENEEAFQAFFESLPAGMDPEGMDGLVGMEHMQEMLDDDQEAIVMGEDGEGFDMEMDLDDDGEDDEEDPHAILDALEDHGGVEATYHPAHTAGHWGWSTDVRAGAPERGRSRLMIDPSDPMSAMFGLPRQSEHGPGQHPLLSNPAFLEDNQRQAITSLLPSSTGDSAASLAERMGPDAVRLVDNILRRHAAAGRQALSIGMSAASDGGVHLEIGGRRYTFPSPAAQNRDDANARETDVSAEFVPRPTLQRWHDEMHICGEDSAKLVNHIINRLLPEAKKRAEEEAAKTKKEDEEAAAAAEKAEEESRKAEEEAEKKAIEARKAEAAAAADVALPTSRVPTPPPQDVEMAESPTVDAAVEAAPAETAPGSGEQAAQAASPVDPSLARTLISIHGRDVDITGTGIDLEFLQALPDEMRADVVEQHMREHNRDRQAVPDAGGSSQISPEFLDALPAEIRSEVMLQEQMERTRRNSEAQARAPPAGAPGDAGEALAGLRQRMRNNRNLREMLTSAEAASGPGGAGIFDLNDPGLGGSLLANLGAGLANIVGPGNAEGRPPHPGLTLAGSRRTPGIPALGESAPKRLRRDAVQLLDKPGVASLVRLLFFPEAFKRDYLQRVLVNLCENSSTRADLLNLLISVVQDGTGDLPAVDKSFSQMSLRPGATPKATPRTPKAPETPAPAPSTSTMGLFAGLQSDHIPTFIAQRCFEALTHIVAANSQAVNYFLTEHEQPVGLRKPVSKKGKGKEKMIPQTKYPIVVLLGFLDRSVLLKAPGMMESFALLLSAITKPLVSMKANMEKATKDKGAEAPQEAGDVTIQPDAVDAAQTPRPLTTATPSRPKAGEASTSAPPTGLPTAPAIPPSILKLVVNCLTVGECSSRTFGYTLSIMQNLSAIPEAKETILNELRDRAQQLGQEILEEVRELHVVIQDQTVEIGTGSLSKFAPASSSQAQLLRLLKTIDYLHSEKVDSDPPGEILTDQEKAIGQTFDTFNFEPMWKELSACLSTVEARGSTDQIATVLLPLVEALMVICKYRRPEISRETRSPSVAPSSTGEADNIFVSFTTTHRKVLNAIVRTNPGLLSGSFSLLVRNPRVLEFDNKRNWFMQKLKRKRDQPAHAPVLHLNLRRQYVFEDSFRALDRRTGNEIKYGKLSVKFHNEDGIDAGGVTREWYSVLAQQIFDPNFALFEPCAADAQTYQPNKASAINEQHLSFFKFVGRVIGKAVVDGRLLDAYFSRAFYKQILGKTVDMRDLESIDPEFHKSLQWMLDNDITDVIDQEFTIEDDQFGEQKIVELKEGGKSIPLTEENKEEYVRLVVQYRVENSIKDQIKAFLNGFYEIIPRNLIQIFEADQLELLISGITSVDVDELKNATQMAGWKASDPEISWFWRALRSFSQEERARFLMFVTSSSRVPLGGFTQLQGASGIQPFQIQKMYSREGSLPQASTCFNLLLLPKYQSYEQLREKLQFAIYETGGFGKA